MPFIAPNWRIESEYPCHTENKSLSFWAWQFLRRNEEYQKEWDGFFDRLTIMVKRHPDLRPFFENTCWVKFPETSGKNDIAGEESARLYALARAQIEYSFFDPPALPSESFDDYQKRLSSEGVEKWHQTHLQNKLGEKWGLERLCNPEREWEPVGVRFLINGNRLRSGGVDKYAVDSNYYAPLFDLRYPVEVLRAQFEFILAERADLIEDKTITPYEGRPLRSLPYYREYLRVLDALDAGETLQEIAATMLSHQDIEGAKKVVRNWSVAAKKIRDESYRLLPAYSTIKGQKK